MRTNNISFGALGGIVGDTGSIRKLMKAVEKDGAVFKNAKPMLNNISESVDTFQKSNLLKQASNEGKATYILAAGDNHIKLLSEDKNVISMIGNVVEVTEKNVESVIGYMRKVLSFSS